MATVETYRPSKGDRVSLGLFAVFGVAIAAASLWSAVARILEVLPNTDVEVRGEFAGTTGQAPIGPGGAPVDVALDRATLTVPSLPDASLWALVAAQVVLATTVVVVVGCLVRLIRDVAAGEIFSPRNTRLVGWAGGVGFLGYAAVPFLENMAANGAFARLSDRTFDNVILTAEPLDLVMVGFVVAMAGTVFAVGDRLRRDTEGLI